MVYILHIPDWMPTSLNKLVNSHWAVASKYKKADRNLIALYATSQEIPKATRKRRVSLRVVLPKGQRSLDNDNVWKSLLDALKHCKLLVDDTPKYCETTTPVWLRSGTELKETFVILEDM